MSTRNTFLDKGLKSYFAAGDRFATLPKFCDVLQNFTSCPRSDSADLGCTPSARNSNQIAGIIRVVSLRGDVVSTRALHAYAQAGNSSNPKDRAKIMTQWYASYYESIANHNPNFIGGWRRNIQIRLAYIEQIP